VAKHIQRRKHAALEDSAQFFKILRVVSFNLLISVVALLVWWLVLLQTKIEADDPLTLPRSYVPPVQGAIWYFCNDFFYFYPHWIAHSIPSNNALYFKCLPKPVAERLPRFLRQAHKKHHLAKANLGVAAWYCSPWEQVLFNLFPALIGPLLTQILADASGYEDIWGTRLVTLYVWVTAATVSSVLAHTGYRSVWNDPGKHDLHHERAFDPKAACNFGTMGFFDWLHETKSSIAVADSLAWRLQRDRQAALWEASRRSGLPLTEEQMAVVKQPDHSAEWLEKDG
jgi:sterol desaturase/sphingolipid hydroxylase (fatty acid hydroxylase superfamily)